MLKTRGLVERRRRSGGIRKSLSPLHVWGSAPEWRAMHPLSESLLPAHPFSRLEVSSLTHQARETQSTGPS